MIQHPGKHSHKFNALVTCDEIEDPIQITVRCGCGLMMKIAKVENQDWRCVETFLPHIRAHRPEPEPATVRFARKLIAEGWETISMSSAGVGERAKKALVDDGYEVEPGVDPGGGHPDRYQPADTSPPEPALVRFALEVIETYTQPVDGDIGDQARAALIADGYDID